MNISSNKLETFLRAAFRVMESEPSFSGFHTFSECLTVQETPERIAYKQFIKSLSKEEQIDILALILYGRNPSISPLTKARELASSEEHLSARIEGACDPSYVIAALWKIAEEAIPQLVANNRQR